MVAIYKHNSGCSANSIGRFLLVLMLFQSSLLSAQVTINTGATVRMNGFMATNMSITNRSSNTNFAGAQVFLTGTSQTANTTQGLRVSSLRVFQGGKKTLQGSWEVTESLELSDGILVVGDNAKLLYSGNDEPQGNDKSFVEGFLYTSGTGRKFYPIGTGTSYLPFIVEDVPQGSPEVGVRAHGSPQFKLPAATSFAGPNSWELSQTVASTVSVSLNGTPGTPSVILQSGEAEGNASVVNGTAQAGYFTSSEPISQRFVALGGHDEFMVEVHDMITPYERDNFNDRLFIQNLDLAQSNKVRLLDRWGAEVWSKADYRNDSEEDFSQLPPGNYICLVEYTLPGSAEKRQMKSMVTVLKTK